MDLEVIGWLWILMRIPLEGICPHEIIREFSSQRRLVFSDTGKQATFTGIGGSQLRVGFTEGGNGDRFKIIKFHVGQTRYLYSQF